MLHKALRIVVILKEPHSKLRNLPARFSVDTMQPYHEFRARNPLLPLRIWEQALPIGRCLTMRPSIADFALT